MGTFKKVLFPTDFSPSASHALQHALRMTEVENGEVIVQHVVSSYFEKHSHWATLFDVHEMQKYMDMYVETEMARITPKEIEGNIKFRNVISEGKPAQQIVELADKERVDLIVMGPAKGAVTGAVIRAAERPVLSVPDGKVSVEPLTKISKLLVGTDFSAHSKKVVDFAFDLKKSLGSELYLLHAIELSRAVRFGISQDSFKDALTRLRTYATNQLTNLTPHEFIGDPSVHFLIEEGTPSDELARCARTYDADMVVMGAHGYGPVQKHFVGTTTDKILSRVQRPLLTVKI